MEWVETTGRTVEEAKDLALDTLGVDEQDAEFEVLEEPRTGLFGRLRGEARVRARVQPKQQRPKQERRDRRGGGRKAADKPRKAAAESAPAKPKASPAKPKARAAAKPKADDAPEAAGPVSDTSTGAAQTKARAASSRPAKGDQRGSKDPEQGSTPVEDIVTVGEQADIMEEFLGGLLDAFGLEGELTRTEIDDETIELGIEGDDLGLLIGPKGQTLQAVQDLARTVAQRRAAGPHEGRVRIDVSGYRQRRREALERFVTQVAASVVETGTRKALEPMGAADRKVVHDTANGIDGVHTVSEGQDPERWVVILPDEA